MTHTEFLAELRELIGNPKQAMVSNRQLAPYVKRGVTWLITELKYSLREDTKSLALTAGVQEYSLPGDVAELKWVRYANRKLDPATTELWDRDGHDYKSADDGIPNEYAYEARTVIFDRPPSAAVIAEYPAASYKYLSSASYLTPAGISRLPEIDVGLAVMRAALLWLAAHPSEVNNQRAQNYAALLNDDLAKALKRHAAPEGDFQPAFGVATSRQGNTRG